MFALIDSTLASFSMMEVDWHTASDSFRETIFAAEKNYTYWN